MKSQLLPIARRFALAFAFAAPVAAASPALAAFRAIEVDLSGLAGGDRVLRSDLSACLAANMAQSLVGRLSPGDRSAPTLVLRPRAVQLAPLYGYNTVRTGFADGVGTDYIEGDALIVPAGRARAAERIPMLAATAADFGGAMMAPTENARRRTAALCHSFTHWIGRSLAGR
jgi:hypothetical protein